MLGRAPTKSARWPLAPRSCRVRSSTQAPSVSSRSHRGEIEDDAALVADGGEEIGDAALDRRRLIGGPARRQASRAARRRCWSIRQPAVRGRRRSWPRRPVSRPVPERVDTASKRREVEAWFNAAWPGMLSRMLRWAAMRLLTIAIERFPIAGRLHHRPRLPHRGRRGHGRDHRRATAARAAANACPTPATARPSRASPRRSRRSGAAIEAGLDRARSAGAAAAGRRPQRARLRALGPRGEAAAACRRMSAPASPACGPVDDRLHHQPRRARRRWPAAARKRGDRPILKIKLGGARATSRGSPPCAPPRPTRP